MTLEENNARLIKALGELLELPKNIINIEIKLGEGRIPLVKCEFYPIK